jgi:sulfhydrogenase subunit alpha
MTHRGGQRTISVRGLSRVEGEGSLRLRVNDGQVEDVALEIFEPPRYFEALLRGRRYEEAPDITARICGICPVAYQMSACAAMEDAAGTEVPTPIRTLRRLLYCGEWIQSHSLHIYLLHAPDFLGYNDAVELAEHDRRSVERGLGLKRTGNLLMEIIGGRAIHPVNVRLGGFYKAPAKRDVVALTEPLARAREAALATVDWVSGFEFPDFEGDYRFVALHDPDVYAIEAASAIRSSDGLDVSPAGFEQLVDEQQVMRSTALQARLRGRGHYLTGPLARYALNGAQLPEIAREAAAAAGLGAICINPFRSIVVRSIELVAACDEALRLVAEYEPPQPAAIGIPAPASAGVGVTEAPRGLLLQRYEVDDAGLIRNARIVPPTSQNQLTIEDDLRATATAFLSHSDAELTLRCEQTVRNHDPCISCAAHFLDVTVERR